MSERRVLLVGWSSADWQFLNPLLDAGRLPALQSVVERGVKADLASLSPMLSPLLWTSLVTGRRPEDHGILSESEPDEATGATRLASSSARRASALWNILDRAGLRTLAVNWPASQPAEPIAGATISNLFAQARAAYGQPWPLPAAAVHPRSHGEILADLRVHAGDFTGDDLRAFIPHLARVDQAADKRPLALAVGLAESVTVHGAITWLMENESWDLAAVYYGALGPLTRFFQPLHSKDEIYGGTAEVIARYHDALLARLLQLAGPETAVVVVSEHGSQAGAPRPYGIFAAAGPGLRQDELIFGAGLLDVAPFVLKLLGLAPSQEMPGRLLAEAFISPPDDARPVTLEPQATESTDDEAWDAAAALAELAALGYTPPPTEGAAQVLLQRDATLAQVHLAAGRFHDAIPLLEKILVTAPSAEVRLALAYAYHRTKRSAEACAQLDAAPPDHPHTALLRAHLAADPEEAFAALQDAARLGAGDALLQFRTGLVYAGLRRWAEADEAYARALALDERMQPAHLGRARVLFEMERYAESVAAALDAVNLRFDDAQAHLVLGAALARHGQPERAIQALETSLRYRPTAEAHRWLAQLRTNPVQAQRHLRRADELS